MGILGLKVLAIKKIERRSRGEMGAAEEVPNYPSRFYGNKIWWVSRSSQLVMITYCILTRLLIV